MIEAMLHPSTLSQNLLLGQFKKLYTAYMTTFSSPGPTLLPLLWMGKREIRRGNSQAAHLLRLSVQRQN